MAKTVKMADIAEKLGISVVTVSKGLSGKYGVSDTLREDIIKTAREMGYSAKQNSENSNEVSYTIGIVTAERFLEFGSSFYWNLYKCLLTHLSAQGDFGLLEVISDFDEHNNNIPRFIQENKVDGVIIMGSFEEKYLKTLLDTNIPVSILDSYQAWFPCDTVISDGYYGMYSLTSYLIREGHRRMKYVGTLGGTSSITDRYFGFCRALHEAGISVSEDDVIQDRDDEGKINVILNKDIVSSADVLVCNCDNTAYDVCMKLSSMGFNVPDDISVTGFDNYILSEMSGVKITTYEVNQDAMAMASAEQIRCRIQNSDAEQSIKIVSGRMIIRESVKLKK